MNKFHQIPTDTFIPISHDNSYLFNHYDKVANFLAFNLERNYKNILAKPVQNGYEFDWFSVYENLRNINDNSNSESNTELIKYWEFIDLINLKIDQLANSNDDNNKNWASLLSKVFDHQNNFIFSNGTDICIVWGWKFDNNKNYKPNLVSNTAFDIQNVENSEKKDSNETFISPPSAPIISEEIKNEIEEPQEEIEEHEEEQEEEIKEKLSFFEFLKWFASKYWWLLWLLTSLIALTFFIKSLIY